MSEAQPSRAEIRISPMSERRAIRRNALPQPRPHCAVAYATSHGSESRGAIS